MKKLLIPFLSIFILVNFAFAQSTQQKVDSLKKEQAKAEQAKKAADERLRQDLSDKNYQAAKASRENYEKVSRELTFALENQKAEQEAKAKAKAEAEAAAKKAAEDKLLALYKKRFPSFAFVGVGGPVKNYMLGELKKNPKWDILDMSLEQSFASGYKINTNVRIKSTSGEKVITLADAHLRIHDDITGEEVEQIEAIALAWRWHKDPEKFYTESAQYTKIEKEKRNYKDAKIKIEKAFKSYYYGYTGRKDGDNINVSGCDKIELYEVEIPNDKNYYRIVSGIERDEGLIWKLRKYHHSRGSTHWHHASLDKYYYDVEILKGTNYVVKCNGEVRMGGSLFNNTYKDAILRPVLKEGRHYMYKEKAKEKIIGDILGPKHLAVVWHVIPADLKPLQKLVKVFKAEDYMQ